LNLTTRSKDFVEVGEKETAEFYARVQLGEKLAIGVHPLLLNWKKAETLRNSGKRARAK